MAVRIMYVGLRRVLGCVVLQARDDAAKNIEILVLSLERHRRRPGTSTPPLFAGVAPSAWAPEVRRLEPP